ncbi:MAG TPA: sodium:solute symporter [bacterium]|nr:sodium:solute symporter [bacterium]HMW36880.1 sodium:solute symporter [bacterium]HND77356.1 sodium:solute symporter [bacterium]HNE84729.1 sodium:solute symporter [bacterium]HNH29716.1 sodium:solute symporter [bacterium]
MTALDWTVLAVSLIFIIAYGIYKSRGVATMDSYVLSNRDMRWWTVAISIMATQASAITFISTPGQGYADGMRFVQFYFGLPLAMVLLCITAVPFYRRLQVYTAYEFLEKQFDLKTRALASFLFLIQRGLGAGLTIYAPSLILSLLLGWNLVLTNLLIGGLVIIYTTTGGARAVNWTQFHQMMIILTGMAAAFVTVIALLPDGISVNDALHLAGSQGKMNTVDFTWDWDNRYTLWSGLIGGFFLQLSYFGTDQSQVGRYLTGQSIAQTRLGLLTNGLLKIPMQFLILLLGVMVFAFYQFTMPPVFFNRLETERIYQSSYAADYVRLENDHTGLFKRQQEILHVWNAAKESGDEMRMEEQETSLREINKQMAAVKEKAKDLIKAHDPSANTNDTNYIFLTFVLDYLPVGLVGLIIAAIFAASMSSTSAELNALASTTVVDIYRRMFRSDASDAHYVRVSKWATVFWGAFAVGFAELAGQLGSLIEAVNILGSLFYGTILGIFLLAFYWKKVGGTSAFTAAIIAEVIVFLCYFFTPISFLWYNVIGCALVVGLAWVIYFFRQKTTLFQG